MAVPKRIRITRSPIASDIFFASCSPTEATLVPIRKSLKWWDASPDGKRNFAKRFAKSREDSRKNGGDNLGVLPLADVASAGSPAYPRDRVARPVDPRPGQGG